MSNDAKLNFAVIVPTKALINETSQKIIKEDLKDLLEEKNYKAVNAASDIALEGKHNFILVLAPERLLYLLIGKPDIQISQMFPADALVSSPRAEKARLYSAIEQRLEQSLKIMDGIISSRVHVSYDVDNGDSGKTALPIHISVLAVYEKDINPEIKINDIKRFIVNSSASVQYENISVVLSKRRDIIEQAPTYEISEPVFAYDKAMPVSILLALISVATCWLLWKYRAILTNLVRLKIK